MTCGVTSEGVVSYEMSYSVAVSLGLEDARQSLRLHGLL